MKYIDLIAQLSEEDKVKIKNYISIYGVNIDDFVGLDTWLQDWSHANQTLFKLLGNQFIYKIPFNYVKSEEEIKSDINWLLHEDPFKEQYHDFYWTFLKKQTYLTSEDLHYFNHLFDACHFVEDKISHSIKIKKPRAKKMLQLQEGMKPMRAIQKVIGYFDMEWKWDLQAFDNFRIAVSRIFNDRKVVGNLCFSIHPFDYMTMSDNNSNWSSCMSWRDEGCYRVGTVEMMNSNNVLCCYVERANADWLFSGRKKIIVDDEVKKDYTWNDKKWRILTYVTKDIIMAGKAYPYKNDDYSKKVIEIVKDLAEKNLNWHYSFGPELYKDMKYVNSDYPLFRARNYIRYHETTKHNILWDTNGMYNDMLNDHNRNYWCYRNKVKQTKVINVSGKCPCLCCGDSIIDYDDCGSSDYNERYYNVSNLICRNCLEEFYCECCGSRDPLQSYIKIAIDNGEPYYTAIKLCEHCAKHNIYECPGCGSPMLIAWKDRDAILSPDTNIKEFEKEEYPISPEGRKNGSCVFMCCSCMMENKDNFYTEEIHPALESYHYFNMVSIRTSKKKDKRWVFFNGDHKYYFPNLKRVTWSILNPVKPVVTRETAINYLFNENSKNT